MEGRGVSKTVLIFLPLLVGYVILVLITASGNFQGDEGRYVMYATNLSHGYYSPKGEIFLWNAPGYPILLVPFIILKIPWLAAKLLNPIFLFIAVLYFYYTLRFYIQERPAIFFAYLLGVYPPFSRYMHMLLTEHLSIFLLCGFMYHFCKLYHENKNSWYQLTFAFIYLGYLALTKAFFGYVILSGILLYFSLYIKDRIYAMKRTFMVYLFALALCIPYLVYTYSLTGKVFYWGNTGGYMLYLMSSPYEEEFGDWGERSSKNHVAFEKEMEGLSALEKESMYKQRAISNIVGHPKKYFRNWLANIGRLLFNYPFSYDSQKLSSYFYFIPNMFLFVPLVLCIYPTIRRWECIPFEIKALILFAVVSFTGSTFLNGENRYIWPLVPIFLLWISIVSVNLIKVEIMS